MAKNVAEQLVDTLEKAGVKRIYAVTGDSLNEVNEAVRKSGKIKWIPRPPRRNRRFCAAAEAQLNGRTGLLCGKQRPWACPPDQRVI